MKSPLPGILAVIVLAGVAMFAFADAPQTRPVFDATFTVRDRTPVKPSTMPATFKRIDWRGSGPDWSPGDGTWDLSEARARAYARRVIAAGSPVTIWDCEAAPWTQALFLERLRQFRDEAPGVRLGVGGLFEFPLNRQDWLQPDQKTQDKIDAVFREWKPTLRAVDFVVTDAYLLGPNDVERDLAYLKAFAVQWRAHTDKPLFAYEWYVYHEAWNKPYPPGIQICEHVLPRYKATVRECFDAVILWGPWPDNARVVE